MSYASLGRQGKILVGGGVLLAIVALSLLAPLIMPYAPDELHVVDRFSPPSLTHLAGTDEYGRDVLSRTLEGSRLSLLMGFLAMAVSLALGVPLGLIAGYKRGGTDEVIMRTLDIMMAFPPIMFVLLILAITPPSLWKTALAVGVLYVPPVARLTRSVTLAISAEEFVEAAHARGERTAYILFREILPNAWGPIIVDASLRVTFAILLAAVLSFLGFGVQPPRADWGLMIAQARSFVATAPWIALAPGLAMCLTVVALNLLGDGLREELDPQVRRAIRR